MRPCLKTLECVDVLGEFIQERIQLARYGGTPRKVLLDNTNVKKAYGRLRKIKDSEDTDVTASKGLPFTFSRGLNRKDFYTLYGADLDKISATPTGTASSMYRERSPKLTPSSLATSAAPARPFARNG